MEKNSITEKDYCKIASLLTSIAQYFTSGATLTGLKDFYDWNLSDEGEGFDMPYWHDIKSSIEIIKKVLSSSDYDNKVTTLINEWNTNVAPILTGVTCNSFDEFAMQVANVAGQCIKYKSAESMQPQQPVPVQSQQNQMFVDVNTLIRENNYLKSLNASKDEEIKVLRERLVALGQPV